MRWSFGTGMIFAAAMAVTGCFVDQPSAADRVCLEGENTCRCLPGDECRTGLTCMEDGRCRDPRCTDGFMGCACIDGVRCEGGLECQDASCLLPPSESTSDSGVDPTQVTSTTTPGSSASASDPMSGTTGESMSDTLPTSEVTGAVSIGGTLADTGMVSETWGESCRCGWRADLDFYACGLDTLPHPPDGTDAYPYDCPEGVTSIHDHGEVASCDAVDPPVTVFGCCLDSGINVWCDSGIIVFEYCTPEYYWCEM